MKKILKNNVLLNKFNSELNEIIEYASSLKVSNKSLEVIANQLKNVIFTKSDETNYIAIPDLLFSIKVDDENIDDDMLNDIKLLFENKKNNPDNSYADFSDLSSFPSIIKTAYRYGLIALLEKKINNLLNMVCFFELDNFFSSFYLKLNSDEEIDDFIKNELELEDGFNYFLELGYGKKDIYFYFETTYSYL